MAVARRPRSVMSSPSVNVVIMYGAIAKPRMTSSPASPHSPSTASNGSDSTHMAVAKRSSRRA